MFLEKKSLLEKGFIIVLYVMVLCIRIKSSELQAVLILQAFL